MKKIRDRAERHVTTNEEPQFEKFIEYLRDEFIGTRGERTETRIETVLEDTPIMPLNSRSTTGSDGEDGSGEGRKSELWYSAQLYGALQNEFTTPDQNPHRKLPHSEYRVWREHENWGIAVDLYVRQERGESSMPYLIEVKRAASVTDVSDVVDQLYRYNTIFETRVHTYLLVLYDPDEPGNEQKSIDKFEDAVNDELRETTVLRNEIKRR